MAPFLPKTIKGMEPASQTRLKLPDLGQLIQSQDVVSFNSAIAACGRGLALSHACRLLSLDRMMRSTARKLQGMEVWDEHNVSALSSLLC